MRKKGILFVICLFNVFFINAQLKSPEAFLGYKIGTRYTPHWKIVSYFEHVAAQSSTNVKLENYGETNEGRTLLLAFISSKENTAVLDEIRMNNMRLANTAKDKRMPDEQNGPAIVWLSYNVHGNEASSSEAAMMTLWALADPANTKTKEWLKNTVVIIDPCVNPDGRDRYVNWYNGMVGTKSNALPETREHNEPWPGGRINHYYFDLNRDWAWQTQIESRQRIKVYQEWLPQVHVDFHEQGINSPYYFAPAAQPYHEVITKWQREFQETVGKNNAKYFDANGWLYFTKEYFDLLYPSYGDTYPTYNGAIGMTYEQAGHSTSGTAVINNEDDTLTLLDRATHHFATSLSTIETASQNASRLVKEFRKYFNDAVSTGVGEYKSYLIKYSETAKQRIDALKGLLNKNDIRYEVVSGSTRGMMTGYHYFSGKEELFGGNNNDIIIPAQQPHSSMVKVLFEPKTQLVDSATYDITAWSLPYVFGLDAYASKNRLEYGQADDRKFVFSSLPDAYGYVLPWQGVRSATALSSLLQQGVRVRFSETAFESGGKKFEKGSLILLKHGNEKFGNKLHEVLTKVVNENKVEANTVSTGMVDKGFDFGSEKVKVIKAPKVAVLAGEGVNPNNLGEIWYFFDHEIKYPVSLINVADYENVKWDDYNVLVMTSGRYPFLDEKSGADKLRDWISNGGRLIAIEGAVGSLSKLNWGLHEKKGADSAAKPEDKNFYSSLHRYEDREREGLKSFVPGTIFKVELDNTHPLAFGYPDYYYTMKQDSRMYEFLKSGWNVGVIKKENQVAGFVGSSLKSKLKDGMIFGAQPLGGGQIIYLADNILFRNFWENGKLLFCNALFMTGN